MDMTSLLIAQGAGQPQRPTVTPEMERQAQEVGERFESMFLAQMMAPMFDGVGESDFFGGQAGKAYKSVLMEEYGKAMAASGGVGIAAQVKAEILKLQEVAR